MPVSNIGSLKYNMVWFLKNELSFENESPIRCLFLKKIPFQRKTQISRYHNRDQ